MGVACESQGLLVFQDSANYARFDVNWDGATMRAFASTVSSNVSTTHLNATIAAPTRPIFIRVQRVGSTFAFSTSSNGTTFTQVGGFTFSMTVNRMGPFAGNSTCGSGGQAPAFTAAVDYFFNTNSPIVPGDAGTNPQITIWNGDNQSFGSPGVPQTWINILGTVLDANGIQSLTYSLNGQRG